MVVDSTSSPIRPASFVKTLNRSPKRLLSSCKLTVLDSGIEAATWGNIVLGGFIGWGVDSAAGADNKYPEQVTITLVPASATATE